MESKKTKQINSWYKSKNQKLGKDHKALTDSIIRHLEFTQAKTPFTATEYDCYMATAYAVNDRLMELWNNTQEEYYKSNCKRAYYFSMEYLPGRLLGNALLNLGMTDAAHKALDNFSHSLQEMEDYEHDMGLGNGGLGRLASCFLDSMATKKIPGMGYGIRYEYGIFEQKIINSEQVEVPDNWLRLGNPWQIVRPEYTFPVKLYGKVESYRNEAGEQKLRWVDCKLVNAIAFDFPIPGHKNDTVNNLRLWRAEGTDNFSLKDFNQGDYIQAMEERILSETISKVLYPQDDFFEGKELRLKQEYFFISASLQDIIRRYKIKNKDIKKLHEKVVIQLNDTHPALSIPELMRILLDEENLSWEDAWNISTKVFAYTNHTIMPEALEKWPINIISNLLPRHTQIIYEINHRFLQEAKQRFNCSDLELEKLSIIEEGNPKLVRMANLSIIGSFSINGVSRIHSDILKDCLFNHFYKIWPNKFNNKTNGITPRLWLEHTNPSLHHLITKSIGDSFNTDLSKLKGLENLVNDDSFIKEWQKSKLENKKTLADYIYKKLNIKVDTQSMFDCQVKRIHEYKRQLLNCLHIITLYNRFKNNNNYHMAPRTFIFAGKSAPGYFMAKLIIRLIHTLADKINNDPKVHDLLKIVFIPNYSVSIAEKIFAASDLSEQISTAGTEASGTGNMKFALNGALTIGTLDGANVELKEEVGSENIFIFGLTAQEILEKRNHGYDPRHFYYLNQELKNAVDFLTNGELHPDRELFAPIVKNLLDFGDYYFLLHDYASYINTQENVSKLFENKIEWTKKSILNCAYSGKFSSDRTIMEYARDIWKIYG